MSGKWVRSRLVRLARIYNGKDYKCNPPGKEYPIYGTGGIMGYTSLPLNSGPAILTGRKGTIDRPVFVNDEFWHVDTVFCIKPNDLIDCKFFYYSFASKNLALLNEATGVPSVTSSSLYNLQLLYPETYKVQQHIAEILSTCDEVIEKSERTKEKLRRIKDGLLADLMTRGIDNDGKIRPRPSKAPHLYKQSDLGLFPKEWEVKRLGDVCSIQLGKMLDAAKNVGVEKPYLGNKAVQWGRIDLAAVEKVRLTDADMAKFRLRRGDLLVCEGGEVGRCVIWNDELPECYYQKAIHRLRMIDPESGSIPYLAGLFAWYAAHDMFRAYVTQTSIAHLPKEKLEALVVVWPKKYEQDQIADRLAAVDARIESEENAIAKYRKIKAGLMHRLLTPPSGAEIVDLTEGAT